MKLKIYNGKTKELREIISPSDNSALTHAAMGEHVLALSFTLPEKVAFEVNDYLEFEGNTYTLLETPMPAMKSTLEWVYDLKFHGIESELKRALVLNDGEPVFALTGKASEHLELIVKNINRVKGLQHGTAGSWDCGTVTLSDNVVINYNGTSCFDALTQLANQLETEWWITEKNIHLVKYEHETSPKIELAYQKGLVSLSRNDNDNVKFFTRLYPIGSSKNINWLHDKDDEEEDGVYRYPYKRLQLPEVNNKRYTYKDLDTEFGIIEHFEEAAFAHIYPRQKDLKVDSVEWIEDKDNPEYKTYFVFDNDFALDDKWLIPGQKPYIVFQSGELNGYEFEVEYVEFSKGLKGFRITNQHPEGFTQLPGGSLKPEKGDRYIIYNIYLPVEFYEEAEREFEQAVNDYLAECSTDKSVYQAETDYIYIKDNGMKLQIGQKVTLKSDELFKEGYRDTRITSITRNVNIPTKMTVSFSDSIAKGKIESLQEGINEAMNFAQTNYIPDIIRSWEHTEPNDMNLYSALKSEREFLSKHRDGTARGFYKFLKGMEFGEFQKGEHGAFIDSMGNTETQNLLVRNLAQILQATIETVGSKEFSNGFTGNGWRIWNDEQDPSDEEKKSTDYKLEIDQLTVRKTMTVFELLIQKVRSVGGELIVSAGNGKIKEVKHEGSDYVITLEETNTFREHDLVRCQTWTGTNIKYYWVEVSSVSENTLTVPVSEFESALPEIGDELVLMGNTRNPERQNLISISASEDGHPRIDILNNVDKTNFANSLRVRLGRLDGITDTELNPKGYGLYSDNAYLKGEFRLVTGEDIKTKFEITEGMIRSEMEGVRKDVSGYQSYLHNAYFGDNLNGWDSKNNTTFFYAGEEFIALEDMLLYSDKNDFTEIRKDGDRTVLCISNSYIQQANANFETHPIFDERDKDTHLLVPKTFYIEFLYKCIQPGTLNIEFPGATSTGFSPFKLLKVENKYIEATSDYQTFEASGLWNGTGDFKLSFDGEIYLYAIRLAEDRLGDMEQRYAHLNTRVTQTEADITSVANALKTTAGGDTIYLEGKVIQKADCLEVAYKQEVNSELGNHSAIQVKADGIAFAVYEDGRKKSSSNIVMSDNTNALYVVDENGKTISLIEQIGDNIKIKAENIDLEGDLTANTYFSVDKNGKLKAKGAYINGRIEANEGYFKGRIEAEEGYFRGKVESNEDGNKIEIDPESRSLKMSMGNVEVMEASFMETYGNIVTSNICMSHYKDNEVIAKLDLNPYEIRFKVQDTILYMGTGCIGAFDESAGFHVGPNYFTGYLDFHLTNLPVSSNGTGIGKGYVYKDGNGFLKVK
ncbi:MAG: hypothetical protein LIO93_10905 [Bacteroidales bacterium]|nr:hypothetical protein [Bacteroidales bacterium]